MLSLRRLPTAAAFTARYSLEPNSHHVSYSRRFIQRRSPKSLISNYQRQAISTSTTTSSSSARHFHTSTTLCSSDDSFHGLKIDDEAFQNENHHDIVVNNTAQQWQRQEVKDDDMLEEAQIVKTPQDKQKTRELIAELVKAEILSYYNSPNKDDTKSSTNSENTERSSAAAADAAATPYDRQMAHLRKATEHHSQLSKHDILQYTKSCRDVGEMYYKLGLMQESEQIAMDGLQNLMERDDDIDENDDSISFVKSQILHLLGGVMARSGEYDEAVHWYEESLRIKRELLKLKEGKSSSSSCKNKLEMMSQLHYEMGKTFNGMAALEVMSGGVQSTNWEKAKTLFRDAESHYLYDFRHLPSHEDNDAHGLNEITKDMVVCMSPHLVELVVNVRSNMGELLIQQKNYGEAVEMFQLGLDVALMDVARMNNSFNTAEIETYDLESPSNNEPSPEERRNAVVELLVKIADCQIASGNYDDAAASYEQALLTHVQFRTLTGYETNQFSENIVTKINTRLPAAASPAASSSLDIGNATTVEAAIRNNLAHALTRIGQLKLALDQYETSLQIKRHIGGDNHIEVGRTLMEMVCI